ncbi:hypothetical protein AHMF7605_11475 [Adhaeribacter arboris]|uniref:Uncharacterized protein n=1 Tax=Adhaeribacter arboris TaxID=2072846 RepID=A0A2T2YF13_9BACT|nr:hypothetical protein [Adhaeribacter arboris]PSR54097.1 hypothetical protein AHMF7605_11475 [Adhaeribacter arboris]
MDTSQELEKRNAIKSLIFYGIYITVIILINASGAFKSGPCTPNLDILSIFLIGPISLILLIKNLGKLFAKHPTKYSTLIHGVGLLTWMVILFLG